MLEIICIIPITLLFSYITYNKIKRENKNLKLENYIDSFNIQIIQLNDVRESIINNINANLDKVSESLYHRVSSLLEENTQMIYKTKTMILSLQTIHTKEKILFCSEQIESMLECLCDQYRDFMTCNILLREELEQYRWNSRFKEFSSHTTNRTLYHSSIAVSYFNNCSSRKELSKRYRQLVKKYHPDNGGDIAIFQKIQLEYDKKRKEF